MPRQRAGGYNAALRLRQRKDAKAELIASINHELRTPLTVVVGYSEVLLSGDVGELNPEQAAMMRRVAVNGQRLHELIEGLVRTTNESVDMDRDLDLGEVMRRVVSTPHITAAPEPGAASA